MKGKVMFFCAALAVLLACIGEFGLSALYGFFFGYLWGMD
jgi:hypothetical protein